jgi:hypothetical protein
MQTHQQQQQLMAQQEQENMLSTIFEASCEEATPMTSLIDVHQQRVQVSPPTPPEDNSDDEIDRPIAPSFASIDDIPVATIFSKNESKIFLYFPTFYLFVYLLDLKYSEYIAQKLQTEVNNRSYSLFFSFSLSKSQCILLQANENSLHGEKISFHNNTTMNHKPTIKHHHHR